jgi:RNA polymerase sigma-70 factor (ECF subfamily)
MTGEPASSIARLVAGAPPAVRARLQELPGAAERLEGLLATARAAWPDVHVPPERFLAFVVERLSATAADPLADLRVEDLYLACGCLEGDARALEAFRATVLPGVRAALGRDGALELYDEIAQLLMTQLFVADGKRRPAALGYRGRGRLGGYVQIMAVRAARRQRRSGGARPRGEEIDALVEGALVAADPELDALKRQYRGVFKRAFERAFATLSARERMILRYEHVEGLNIDAIGVLYGVHRATVARWRAKARAALLNQTRRVFVGELDMESREFSSVMRLIESQFDLSLSRLLGPVGEDGEDDEGGEQRPP